MEGGPTWGHSGLLMAPCAKGARGPRHAARNAAAAAGQTTAAPLPFHDGKAEALDRREPVGAVCPREDRLSEACACGCVGGRGRAEPRQGALRVVEAALHGEDKLVGRPLSWPRAPRRPSVYRAAGRPRCPVSAPHVSQLSVLPKQRLAEAVHTRTHLASLTLEGLHSPLRPLQLDLQAKASGGAPRQLITRGQRRRRVPGSPVTQALHVVPEHRVLAAQVAEAGGRRHLASAAEVRDWRQRIRVAVLP